MFPKPLKPLFLVSFPVSFPVSFRVKHRALPGRGGTQQQFGSPSHLLHGPSLGHRFRGRLEAASCAAAKAKGETLTIAGYKHFAPPSRVRDPRVKVA